MRLFPRSLKNFNNSLRMLSLNIKVCECTTMYIKRTLCRSPISTTWRRYQTTTTKTEETAAVEKQVTPPPDSPPGGPPSTSSMSATPTPPLTVDVAIPAPVNLHVPEAGATVTGALVDVDRQQEERLRLAATFDEMPGPNMLKVLARAWSYLPRVSNQFTAGAMVYFMNMLGRIDDRSGVGATLVWNRGTAPFIHMFDKYGPVVRLQGIFGGDIVFVARPDHIETVFRQEGRYPLRSSLDSLEKYRVQHRRQSVGGLFTTSGTEWEHLRSKLEIPLNKSVSHYAAPLDNIADEFVENLGKILNRQDEVPDNFDQEIFKWSLECVALVCLGERMGCVSQESGRMAAGDGLDLLEAAARASSALRRCESGFQLWRLVETPSWRALKAACLDMDNILLKRIRKLEASLQEATIEGHLKATGATSGSGSLGEMEAWSLASWLLAGGALRPEDALTVLMDALLLGSNACAHSVAFLLYHLARSPRAQRTLYCEIEGSFLADELNQEAIVNEAVAELQKAGLGKGGEEEHLVDESVPQLHQLPFLRACLRESLRLNPPIPVLTRVLPTDIALHNYRVPKGTLVLMASHVAGLREEEFEDARKFKPQRWLSSDRDQHPFATTPFGSGPRACVAQRLAEMQICMLIAKIIKNYKVEYNYGTIFPNNRLIAMPNKPLKFRFIERSS